MFLIKQFILINGHFTLNLLAALVFFAVAWLYFDAWLGRRDYREGTKSLGFILLSISFLIHATTIEQALLNTSLLGSDTLGYSTGFFRIIAYFVLIIGQIIDPIQPLPEYRFDKNNASSAAIFASTIPFSHLLPFSYPILAIITSLLYLRRATIGLEHHLKTISWSLALLAISDTIGLAAVFRETSDISIIKITEPFGIVWLVEHLFLVIAILYLGKWVWSYLVKRLETQMLMILTSTTLIIFLITTIFFTTTSIRNIQRNTLANLEVSANVLNYSLVSKMAESLSDAQLVAQNADIIKAILDKDNDTLSAKATEILLAKKQSILTITSETGEVLVRGDDPSKSSGSLSDDPLVKKALSGNNASSVVIKEGVTAPAVSVRGAVPIKNGDDILGTAMVGTVIDNAFVDGLKKATGLDASVYADNIRSATTFVAPDGKSRWIGVREETEEIKKTVLAEGNVYTGSVEILNVPFYAAYIPLRDQSDHPVGMLFVGEPQTVLLKSASESIELTFLVTAGLLVLSIFPSFMISRYIISQII